MIADTEMGEFREITNDELSKLSEMQNQNMTLEFFISHATGMSIDEVNKSLFLNDTNME